MLRLLAGQLLHGDLAIIDVPCTLQQVQLRHLERLVGRSMPVTRAPRSAMLSDEDAAAAAHIQDAFAGQARDARRYSPSRSGLISCSGLELALGIPPAMSELAELFQLLRIGVEPLAHACGAIRCCQLAALAASCATSRVVRRPSSSSGRPPTHTWLTCSRDAA